LEETEQGSELDSDMAAVWELSDQEFKTTMINMIRTLMNKGDNIQEQMCSNDTREEKEE